MCGIYINTDPILYESRTRSLRIHGVITSIRMENAFWNVLQEIAEREGKTTNQLIATLHEELTEQRGEAGNFASFLRVCCLRYQAMNGAMNEATPEHRAVAAKALVPAPQLAALKVVQ
ncbi:MAG: ribbon-helix-helix domain-containing protein [Rhodospirillales bacterium]|jgi:predicted DNA-binding ribbon-helix-helix protein|nr:ribbon-helix-helix domain-containing protein [Rhodospirillales bacterium]